ncbi:MAG: TPM domain-containing protein [Bacteroidota bacterium]
MKSTGAPKTIAVTTLLVLLVLAIAFEVAYSQTYTIETVPNQKVLANHLVSNPDGILSAETEALLNQKLDSLEQTSSAQIAVVLLHSIGEESEFDFAQALFRHWGIGQAQNDNGLLILFVEDKRVIRFHTGFGLEGILPDVVCKRIQMEKMVPRFKEGDVDGGLVAGVNEVIKIVGDPAYAEEVNNTEGGMEEWGPDHWLGLAVFISVPWLLIFLIVFFVKRPCGFSNSIRGPGKEAMHTLLSKGQWLLLYWLLPPVVFMVASSYGSGWIFLVSIYTYFGVLVILKFLHLEVQTRRLVARGAFHELYQFYRANKGFWITMTVFFPLPFLLLIGRYFSTMGSLRTRPRKCKNCSAKMHRLDDLAEDEFLQKSMLLEEEIKSVDYDVWQCAQCHHLAIEAYYNDKTAYVPCPKCRTIAYREVERRTVNEATTSSSGLREINKACEFCNYKRTETETIPMIVVSSSSSDSSSSSSDSGGSFGGGDSGGGGASSSW